MNLPTLSLLLLLSTTTTGKRIDFQLPDFINTFLNWKDARLNYDECLFLNFGSDFHVEQAQIHLTLEMSELPDLRPFVSFTDPVACSLAVVGAQYRSRLAAVLSMLDQLTDQTDRVPLAVFLLSEDEEGDVMEYNNSTLRHPFSPLLVSVPTHKLAEGHFTFNIICSGLFNSTPGTLLYRDKTILTRENNLEAVCQDRVVNIQYYRSSFLEDGELNTKLSNYDQSDRNYQRTTPMEMMDIFFKKYKIRPNFINWYDNAQNASFEIYHGDWWCESGMPWYCTPPYDYVPWFIFTRFPRELSKITTLVRICTPVVWMLIFLSLFSVCAFFKLNFYVGKNLGLKFGHEEILLCPFRVLVLVPMPSKTFKGFSGSVVFGLWCIIGGFILHFITSTLLTHLVKPVLEKPVETIQEFLDRNMTLVLGGEYLGDYIRILRESEIKKYSELGKNVILPNWDEKESLKEKIMEEGTHGITVTVRAIQNVDYYPNSFGRWYKSRESLLSENPYTNCLLTKKKWPLNEQFGIHSLYFQQAGLINQYTYESEQEESQKFHVLQLDHFSLPFTLWAVGMLFSTIAIIIELIFFKHKHN